MATIPNNFSPIFSPAQIAEATAKLATPITEWAVQAEAETGRDVVAVPILRGGLFFFADLVRVIRTSVEVVPMRTAVYEDGVNQSQNQQARIDVGSFDLRGRAVLLVDDICDSGKTLALLGPRLRELGAVEVRSAVLIRREVPGAMAKPDWYGLEYAGPEWFVGYGMEDQNRWRNLPGVYLIR